MSRRLFITVFAAIVSAAGASVLSATPPSAATQGISDRRCDADGLCLLEHHTKCYYGQYDPMQGCVTSWPTCETCVDDCCTTHPGGQT